MPSNNDPKSSVGSGPGKLPTGVVPSSALLFPSGGGSGAALEAHILNPHDAHMSGAIGIPAINPTNGDLLLASAGGPINGESVLDFIDQFKDLLPPQPNFLGTNTAANSGIPNWGGINAQITGAFKRASAVQPSHYLFANGLVTFTTTGVLYPADRGVLALYKNTDGQFTSGANTLVAALWLGPNPPPVGIPSANWNPALKSTLQPNYVASGVGLDQIGLTFRFPVEANYSVAPWSGSPYANYPITFTSFQIATFAIMAQALSAGDTGSFILVQWRETFATSLAAINGTVLPAALTSLNTYSTIPGGSVGSGAYDTGAPATINRRNVFVDAGSGTAASGNTFTTSPNGGAGTIFLSGVSHYNDSPLTFNVTLDANHLFTNTFDTSTSAGDLPAGYTGFTTIDPVVLNFANFGGGTLGVPYTGLHPLGLPGSPYTPSNPPGTADVGEYTNSTLAIASPTNFTLAVPASPWTGALSVLSANLSTPFHANTAFNDSKLYIYNSWPQSGGSAGSTTTFDPMTDEQYRYLSSFAASSPTLPVLPAGGNQYVSSSVLTAGGADLQVVGGWLVYPQTNYSGASVRPTSQPNYSTIPGADGSNHLRRYVRAFDTGTPRNTGHLTIRGLAIPTGVRINPFQTNAAFNGTETTGHVWTSNGGDANVTGGFIIQVKIPGATGWLDLGRASTDPVAGGSADFDGCATNYTYSGSDTIISFNTTAQTANNGSGQFPLFVRITVISGINNGGTLSIQHAIDQITWAP